MLYYKNLVCTPIFQKTKGRPGFNSVVSRNTVLQMTRNVSSSVMKVDLSYFMPQIPNQIGVGPEMREMWNSLQL
uniref:Uncharacterized protein n=1 Tax=Lepeophtheirus salmonis TaxID=72036 RepID=A0A0K2VDY6_LEPSM